MPAYHLADPDAGLRALRAALRPGGARYLMVYAPYGRTGVYRTAATRATIWFCPLTRTKAGSSTLSMDIAASRRLSSTPSWTMAGR